MKWALLLTLDLLVWFSTGSEILVLISTPARSHHILFHALIAELASRGHQVTVYSCFELPKPHPNVTEVIVPDALTNILRTADVAHMKKQDENPILSLFYKSNREGQFLTEKFLGYPQVQELIISNKKFDVIINEIFLNEAVAGGFSHKLKAPFVGFSPAIYAMWTDYLVGNPEYHGVHPFFLLPHSTDMTFTERVYNVIIGVFADLWNRVYHIPSQDKLMRKYFGNDLPYLGDILQNASLVLQNYDHRYSFTRPNVPNLIEIGSIGVKPPQRLPQDIQKYLDGSKNGVVVFSMGSMIQGTSLPADKISIFKDAFSKLEQNVVWKFENESLSDLPKNVKLFKWLPQADILAHPKVRVLINHGGLGSTVEALHRGVPLIGIPIVGDEPINVRFAETEGYGKGLDWDTLTVDKMVETIREVVNNPKYKDNAMKRSAVLKDSPLSALDRAVFWIEYVVRHEGAPHLRSANQDLAWYQYYLLDVIIFFFVITFVVIFIAIKCLSFVVKKLVFSKNKREKKETRHRKSKAKKDQ